MTPFCLRKKIYSLILGNKYFAFSLAQRFGKKWTYTCRICAHLSTSADDKAGIGMFILDMFFWNDHCIFFPFPHPLIVFYGQEDMFCFCLITYIWSCYFVWCSVPYEYTLPFAVPSPSHHQSLVSSLPPPSQTVMPNLRPGREMISLPCVFWVTILCFTAAWFSWDIFW